MGAQLLSLLADANSHTAAAPDEGIGLPIILGILAAVLIGGWLMWRLFSGRTRTPVAENLEETPDRERFRHDDAVGVGQPGNDPAQHGS
jgi:hypothetical protein